MNEGTAEKCSRIPDRNQTYHVRVVTKILVNKETYQSFHTEGSIHSLMSL